MYTKEDLLDTIEEEYEYADKTLVDCKVFQKSNGFFAVTVVEDNDLLIGIDIDFFDASGNHIVGMYLTEDEKLYLAHYLLGYIAGDF